MLDCIEASQRIVVKFGTAVVTHPSGEFALGRVHGLVESLVSLHRRGKQIVLVSSGSVGLGASVLGLESRPRGLGLRQACAAAGQGKLIGLYERAFGMYGIAVAQVLLTQRDLADADRALCLRTTLLRVLEHGALPILNENDSVSVRELIEHRGDSPTEARGFGDNDALSAQVAAAIDAELLVLLTNVDGVFSDNPRNNPTAQRLPVLEDLGPTILARAQGQSDAGTGGMSSKLAAARTARAAGVDVWIADGTRPAILDSLARGKDIGTRIPTDAPRSARRRAIALVRQRAGILTINAGAARALRSGKASLLPVGVLNVQGDFARGDVVELRDEAGRSLGSGRVNYRSHEIERIRGIHSDQIIDRLGYVGYDAVVNRQNMALVELTSEAEADSASPDDDSDR